MVIREARAAPAWAHAKQPEKKQSSNNNNKKDTTPAARDHSVAPPIKHAQEPLASQCAVLLVS